MARPSDLGAVELDPRDVERYQRIIAPQPSPIEPPQEDHPIVQFARQQLAPLRGMDTTPRESGRTGQVVVPRQPNYGPGQMTQAPVGAPPPIDFGPLFGPSGSIREAARNIPVLGGVLEFGREQMERGAFGGPQYRLNEALASGDTEAASQEAIGVVGGAVGNLTKAGGPLGQRMFARSAEQVASSAGKKTAAQAAFADDLAKQVAAKEAQRAKLIEQGFTPQQVDEFAATMAPATKPKPKFTIQTAEGQQVDPGLLTRSIQAVTESVPLSKHSILGAKVAELRKGVPANKWGGDIGAATQLVMKGDEDALRIFGPALSQQLIQNKIAHLVRQTGAPEETIRRGLSVMGPDAATAPVAQVATVAKNVRIVEDALGVPPQKAGFRKTAEELVLERTVPGEAPRPGGGGPPPPRGPGLLATSPGGRSELPIIPNRASAGDIAKNLAAELFALPRALKAGLDLSAVLLQGSILIAKDVTKLPFYAYTAARGGTQRPYFHSALGQMFRAVASGEGRVAQVTAGMREAVEREGFRTSGALKNIHIADPVGGFGDLAAREEYMVGNLVTKLPVIGLLFRQSNFGYATLLNALRTGEALNLARAAREVGIPVNHSKIGHFVNIATGYGDLPLQDTDAARKVAGGLANVFFGPRLQTSVMQNVADNVAAIRGIGGSALRKPLDPTDIARLHATVAFVATGVGAMKIAEASGLRIGTDPTGTDFGRMTLPNGWRVDLWGPYNEYARTIAREVEFVRRTFAGDPPGYGEKNGIEEIQNFVRGKLNPPFAVVADIIAGKTYGGVPTMEAYGSADPNVNPLIPAPFSVGTAVGGAGPGLTVLGAFGAGVMPPSGFVKYDGIGRPESNSEFGKDPIFEEYARLFPGKQLEAPDSVLGSGKNTFPLPPDQRETYVRMVGDERRIALGNLIYSQEYQNATKAQQEKLYKKVQSDADAKANREYLKSGIIQSEDPALVTAAAVTGFHAQGSNKDAAYWIATLDKAGKLTPEVKRAIDESNVALPGAPQPITVDEYLKAAPLVHEYLRHAPYGSDKNPIGTPADWVAVDAAKKQTSVLRDQYIRAGTEPSLADTRAKVDALKTLTNMVQRSLYVNGNNLVNPQRRLLEQRYKTMLTRFLGPGADYTQELESQYP